MEERAFKHVVPMQVRFNDVDKFGHVNNTIYFQYYDTAKTEYIFDVCPDIDWTKVAIIVVHIEADFVAQIVGQAHIACRTRVETIGHKSFTLRQEVFDVDSGEVKCICHSVMLAFDLTTHSTMLLPDEWVESICRYEGVDLREKA